MKATAKQRAAFGTICDTFVPGDGLTLPSATEIGAVDTVFELLGRNPREAEGKQLATLLDVWDSPVTGLLTGRGPRLRNPAAAALVDHLTRREDPSPPATRRRAA